MYVNGYLLFLDLIIQDLKFGLGVAPWDMERIEEKDVTHLLSNIAFLNGNHPRVMIFVVHSRDIGMVWKVMETAGYTGIHTMFMYKNKQNFTGVNSFIFAVETYLIGYHGVSETLMFPDRQKNPMTRHNMWFAPQVGSERRVKPDGKPVNPTQKPACTAFRLAEIFCSTGSWALVLGFGAGGEVMGLAAGGVNVLAFENDPEQFRFLPQWLNEEDSKNIECFVELLETQAKHQELLQEVVTVDATPHFVLDRARALIDMEERRLVSPSRSKNKNSNSAVPASSRTVVAQKSPRVSMLFCYIWLVFASSSFLILM